MPPPMPMGAPAAGPMGAPPMGGGMMDPAAMGMGAPPAMQMAMAAEQLPPEVLQAAQGLTAEGVGAAVNEEVERSIQNLDGATDFRDIMNTVWDGDADIDIYRGKLADIVGWEDADRTPDSVLALVQPTLQLAAETGALVNAVGGMSPTGPPAAPEGPPIDPMMLEAMMQGAGPMGQGMV
jgi:hypothetical protein